MKCDYDVARSLIMDVIVVVHRPATECEVPGQPVFYALERVLNKAQNRPPQGGADGSINEKQWHNLRKARDGLRQFIDGAQEFLKPAGGWVCDMRRTNG